MNATMLPMKKSITLAVMFLSVGLVLPASARSQQSSTQQGTTQSSSTKPSSTPQNPAAKTPPAQPAPAQPAAPAPPPLNPAFQTQKQQEGYALGMNIGRGLTRQSVDVDVDSLLKGLKDTLSGSKLVLSDQDATATLNELQQEVREKQQLAEMKAGEANMKAGEEFLIANKTKEGVVALPSGLQYKIITAGTGPKPAASDTVVCNYKGTLLDGTEFDSSYKRGQPASFPVGQVIKGWTEALQLMPVGSKWQLFIPPDLAYGSRGAGGVIGPNATLIFEVELISIKGK
jgi:FKBP-type peptidyl-prolyl cis-trans isomerase FklB